MFKRIISRITGDDRVSSDPRLAQKSPQQSSSPATTTEPVVPFNARLKAAEFMNEPAEILVPSDLLHPDKEGIEVVGTRELLTANRGLIGQALEAFGNKHFIPDFDDQILELIRRTAHWMGPIPASKAHHHSSRGGLFTHSLGVAVGALHMSVGRNVTLESTPRNRDADVLAWHLICFIGGLLHDIGKVNTLGHVRALSVQAEPEATGKFRSSSAPVYDHQWEPMVEGFEGWVKTHRVKSYFIDFDVRETMPHRDFTSRYIQVLVPRVLLSFIYTSNRIVRQQFEDFIRNPESGSRAPIFQVVQDADHLNVAHSMDPRRKPGAIEISSLVLRRFTEFAADAVWNMPMSSFIYAHVQKQTPDGLRFFGIPFFVATEASISAFMTFIQNRPLLGVRFDDRMHETIFNTLETANVMSRTIEGVLPRAIPDPALQDYIPASRADLRFRAVHVEGVLKPVNGGHDDLLTTLPVIPIKCIVPAHVAFNAPTLAFDGVPATSAATVVPATIDKGALEPSDPTLRNDPAYMKQFESLTKADLSDLDRDVLLKLQQIKPAVAEARRDQPLAARQISNKLKAEDLPLFQNEDGNSKPAATPAPMTPISATPVSAPAEDRGPPEKASSTPAAEAATAPAAPAAPSEDGEELQLWQRYCDRLLAAGEDMSPTTFWPMVWLYLTENPGRPKYECQPTAKATGGYGFTGPIPERIRQDMMAEFKSRYETVAPFSRHWPKTKVVPNTPMIANILIPLRKKPKHDPAVKAPLMVFTHAGCEVIERFLQEIEETGAAPCG